MERSQWIVTWVAIGIAIGWPAIFLAPALLILAWPFLLMSGTAFTLALLPVGPPQRHNPQAWRGRE